MFEWVELEERFVLRRGLVIGDANMSDVMASFGIYNQHLYQINHYISFLKLRILIYSSVVLFN